jgi:hypothetical protein
MSMKVTKEMVERAEAQWEHGCRDMRVALEAALADVPELTAFERAALGQHGRDKDRIAELEAKLAKVSERAEDIGLNESDVAYLVGERE